MQIAPKPVPRRTSTLIGLVALALLPVVPMPIAGGTPISIALLLVMFMAQLVGGRGTRLDRTDMLLIVLSVALLAFESITVLMTGSDADLQYALARIYWIVLLIVTLFFTNDEIQRGNAKFIFNVMSLGLAILLGAMLAQSLFYPEYDVGRDFGFVQMPFPRATGVPNSDGKIGTFLAICLTVGLFYGNRLGRRKHFFLLLGPFAGLLFTQSRSGLLAYFAIIGLYWIYRCFSDPSILRLTLRWLVVIAFALVLFYFTSSILLNLVGQGTLETNVVSRGHLAVYAYEKITSSPLFGSGASAIAERLTPVHNTVLAMSVKSGLPAGMLIMFTIIYPALVFRGNMRFTSFKLALVAGFVVEHSLYPGFVNEFIVIGYVVAKAVWRLSLPSPRPGLAAGRPARAGHHGPTGPRPGVSRSSPGLPIYP